MPPSAELTLPPFARELACRRVTSLSKNGRCRLSLSRSLSFSRYHLPPSSLPSPAHSLRLVLYHEPTTSSSPWSLAAAAAAATAARSHSLSLALVLALSLLSSSFPSLVSSLLAFLPSPALFPAFSVHHIAAVRAFPLETQGPFSSSTALSCSSTASGSRAPSIVARTHLLRRRVVFSSPPPRVPSTVHRSVDDGAYPNGLRGRKALSRSHSLPFYLSISARTTEGGGEGERDTRRGTNDARIGWHRVCRRQPREQPSGKGVRQKGKRRVDGGRE